MRVVMDEERGVPVMRQDGPIAVQFWLDDSIKHSPEWICELLAPSGDRFKQSGSRVEEVIAFCPDFKDEIIARTRNALAAAKESMLAANEAVRDAIEQGDYEAASDRMDDLASWVAGALAKELAEAERS